MKDDGSPIHGFVATMISLRERFDSDHFAFCFDVGKIKRCEVLPGYKDRPRNPEHEEDHKRAKDAMTLLRRSILPSMGFQNIFSQSGYEADDIIASIVQGSLGEDQATIISTDNDLYQLLSDKVVMYNPNKEEITNKKTFANMWFGLEPEDWPTIKSIAGCKSDNVPGVKGVGELTAAKYVANCLPKHLGTYAKIKGQSREEREMNLRLVRLPYAGTGAFPLSLDEDIDWRKIQSGVYTKGY